MATEFHPDKNLLRSVAGGTASPHEVEEVTRHTGLCAECAQTIDELSRQMPPCGDERRSVLPSDSAGSSNPAPDKVDPPEADPRNASEEQSFSFNNIRDLCTTFVKQQGDVNLPSLSELVRKLPATAQPTLLRNLLHADLRNRRETGVIPQVDDYAASIPEHENLIRQVFFEATSSPHLQSTASSGSEQETFEETEVLSVGNLLGDYRLVRPLGQGGMGVVFEAVHIRRGHRVALKTLPDVDAQRLQYFKREFRAMAEVNHPNLIGLHSLEADGGHWFLTMDLIRGTDFLSWVRPDGRLEADRLRSGLAQLAAAVLALHSNHIIHRDLKPSNVLVRNDGQVIVLDFGLVFEEQRLDDVSFQSGAGTPAYMAPEQAFGASISGAADWYSIGVMLYEAMSGRRPFSAATAMQLLLEKQNREVMPLAVTDGIPADLADLAVRLLARDPLKRPDPFEIAQLVCSSLAPIPAARTGSSTIVVGRELQLAAMKSACDRVALDGVPGVVFVRGRSGEGKTTLVDCFLQTVRQDHGTITILSGRCYDRESVPFKALDSLIDALTKYLHRLPESEAALMMPDDIDFLARLFPVLRRVSVVQRLLSGNVVKLDQQQVRTRAFAALRSLMKRMTRSRPMVLFADDLQWGDADSAEVVYDVIKPPEGPSILFIGSYRSDETDSSPFLKRWQQLTSENTLMSCQDVTVSPLTVEQCVQLTIMLAGRDEESVRRRALEFAMQTGGNPFLLTELISCFDPSTDSFRVMPIHEVIASKLERLPQEAGSLLDVISVSGKALSLNEAARTVGSEEVANSVITHMRSEKLVRLIGTDTDSKVDTYHDKIRETVLSQMTHGSRQALHMALGQVIENSQGGMADDQLETLLAGKSEIPESLKTRVFDLAYHFDAGGVSRRACVYALVAADQAAQQFSQRVAADQYAIARRNAPKSNRDLQFRIARGEGRALSLIGEYTPAAEIVERAVHLTDDPLQQAQILGLQAEIEHKKGEIGNGIRHYSAALRTLGHFVPESLPATLAALAYESLIQALHTILPERLYKSEKPLNAKEELVVEIANRNSIACYYSNVVRMIWTHLKGLNLAETRQPSRGLAYACGLHPAPVSAIGLCARGLRYSDRALQISEGMEDLLTQGHCHAMRCMAFYTTGQYSAAVESAQRSIDLLIRAGDPYVIFIAECHASFSSTRLTHVNAAIDFASRGFERALQRGELASCAGLLLAWSLATQGNLPFAELRACFRVGHDDHFSNSLAELAEGIWHLSAGRNQKAIDVLESSWRRALRCLVIVPYTVATGAWLANALRQLAESQEKSNPALRKRLLRRASAVTRLSWFLSLMYPAERCHVLREMGLLLELQGATSRALRRLKASLRLAERHGDVYQQALSAVECGRMEQRLGVPGGAERVAAGEEVMRRVRDEIESRQIHQPQTGR